MNIRIPVSWLREYLHTDVNTKTIANSLSLCGPSIERTDRVEKDLVFDIEVTSNRVDALSVWGIAREAHAILKYQGLKSSLKEPSGLNTPLEPDAKTKVSLDVLIKNPSLCPRFAAIVVDNVTIQDSPAIIKNRLTAVGIRPINNVVDITNYIMLELGQPMHAFDFDKVKGAKMILRESKDGEKIITLDGQSRKLPAGSIVIEDGDSRLIDLCGIMGAQNSQITNRTKMVVLFVQSYDPVRIRKTTQALAFRTDAAAIFEKGVDAEFIPKAMARSTYLIKKFTGANIASELIDIKNVKSTPVKILLSAQKLNKILGIQLEPKITASILESLGFTVKLSQHEISATPPSWRTADVLEDVDLIEEIARIYGYHNLPSAPLTGPIPQREDSDLAKVIKLKEQLKVLGLTEVISYSIISKNFLQLTGVSEIDAVELANPLTEEWQFMRPTLLVSLADVVAKNQNIKSDLKIFEIAKTYIKQTSGLPTQDLMLTIVLQNAGFYEIKGYVENVFTLLKRNPSFEKNRGGDTLFEIDQSAQIKVDGRAVGAVGILKSEIIDGLNIESPIAAAEINLSLIYCQPSIISSYSPISKFPPVMEDISIIVAKKTPLADVVNSVEKHGQPLVKKVEVIDIFEDAKIGADKKSITVRLTFQKTTSTPTQDEVFTTKRQIINALEKDLNAKIRS